jgi:hypothetical protein
METQATGLKQALPELSLDGESQAAMLELAARLKDTAGRVTFELALLQAELGEGEMPDTAAVQRLSNLDSTMMTALDAVADVAGQLEKAAELSEQCEPPFALVMQAARVMLRKFGNARAATQVLTDEIAAESTQLRAPEREQTPDVRVAADGSVVILRAGAEGGDVTLIGRTTNAGTWAFARVTDDQTEALFGESGVQIEAPSAPKPDDWVESWDDGLRLMDRYKWARLHPLYVHPAFMERVRVAVEERLANEPQDRWTETAREKWEGLFGRGGQGL